MRYLSVCTIAKNETDYLLEWVSQGLVVGVEHYTIYDNESIIPVRNTLKPLVDKGIVRVINWPGREKQMPAYDHYLKNFGHETVWAAIFDLDEFLIPQIKDTVPEILQEYEKIDNMAAFQASWRIFGSSNHKTKPEGLVIENYTKALPKSHHENTHTKSIMRPNRTHSAGTNPHFMIPKRGFRNISEHHRIVVNAWVAHSSQKLQLNHYITKSLAEFTEKLKKGRIDTDKEPPRQMDAFNYFDNAATEVDVSASRFIEPTKLMMEQFK